MSNPASDEKRFILRKYVMAKCAKEALEKESAIPVQDVFLDEKQPDANHLENAIGFKQVDNSFPFEY